MECEYGVTIYLASADVTIRILVPASPVFQDFGSLGVSMFFMS